MVASSKHYHVWKKLLPIISFLMSLTIFKWLTNYNLQGDSVEQSDEIEEIETGLVLRSIGYKSIQADPSVAFDPKKGTFRFDLFY